MAGDGLDVRKSLGMPRPAGPEAITNVRLAEAASLAAIDALIAEASIEAEQARANKDRTARRIAIAGRNAATKRGLEFK